MNFFKELEAIIECSSPKDKIESFKRFYNEYLSNSLDFENGSFVKRFDKPSYSSFCKIVSAQKVPKRSNLATKKGQANLLHAIAHIEYSAIDLALDAAYRFRGLPKKFYDDWLEVANDEIRHFLSIKSLLNIIDVEYGDIEVHNALFEASQKTQTLLERMAIVPRYLEANGLDATPLILKKLHKIPQNEMVKNIISALEMIVEEEISHVKKGSYWFEYASKLENKNRDIYFDIVKKYYPRGFLRVNDMNIKARKEAGFSCDELEVIRHFQK